MRIIKSALFHIAKFNRRIVYKKQLKLKNSNFTIISSNCNGAILLNEMGLKFLSPTVNLYFEAEHFIKLLENPQHYFEYEPQEVELGFLYPTAILDDIVIHFVHYNTFVEAKVKWNERTQRINWDNLFIIMTDRDDCNESLISRFNNLKFNNKVIFTSKAYPQFKSAFQIMAFKNFDFVGNLYEFKNIFGEKYYDEFDFIHWFNTAELKRR